MSDKKCTACGEQYISHQIGLTGGMCCICYVQAGNPPADWHVACLATEALMRRGEAVTRESVKREMGIP